MTEFLKSINGNRVDTPSFTNRRFVLSFLSFSFFPFRLPFLWSPCSPSFFYPPSLPHPPSPTFSSFSSSPILFSLTSSLASLSTSIFVSCLAPLPSTNWSGHVLHAWPLYSLTMSPSSFGNAPLSCKILWTFLCHESSHFKIIPQSSLFLSCHSPLLSFDLPVFCFPGRDPAVFKDLNSFSHLTVHFCAYELAAVLQFGSHSLPRIARTFSAPSQHFTLPVHSSYHIMSSQMSLSSVSHMF